MVIVNLEGDNMSIYPFLYGVFCVTYLDLVLDGRLSLSDPVGSLLWIVVLFVMNVCIFFFMSFCMGSTKFVKEIESKTAVAKLTVFIIACLVFMILCGMLQGDKLAYMARGH